jgi:NTE family protein
MVESWHRARDIMHIDKTDQSVRISKTVSRYLLIIKKMHDILETASLDENSKKKFKELESEYQKLACERGTIIKEIVRVERKEESHYLFEDADFSIDTIKKLIQNGENDAMKYLTNFGKN